MARDHVSPRLTGDDLATWSTLATLLEWLPAALDTQLQEDADLTHFEYGILYALADAPAGALRMSVLAGFAHSSLSRMSRAVTRLERRGLARRDPDPDDGRSTLATLTAAGRELFDEATPGHVALVRRLVLDPLTRTQQRRLEEIGRRILGSIRDDGGWRPAPDPARGTP